MLNSSANALTGTEYHFEGQTGLYNGKVRDVYTIRDKYIVAIATDRISAFDVVLPRPIPYKGQVLNQLAAYFLKSTKDIASNWFTSSPDANVSMGYKCEPFKVEIVVRGMLVGHAWREYREGKRALCGEPMPEGLHEFNLFDHPIITPSTKAESGHDEDISAESIVQNDLATQEELDEMRELALKLFARGQEMAEAKGLLLADTKYEFGLKDGKIMLIDEIHTPDSSRYFYLDSYNDYIKGVSDQKPRHLSKEFTRNWLMENGFSGKPGQQMPEMTEKIIKEISDRYIELYEKLTGQEFVRLEYTDITARIEKNIIKEIRSLE